MAANVQAEEREAPGPDDVLGDLETLDALDAEIERVRRREERRLINLARKAGLFQVRIRNDELAEMFRQALIMVPRRPSMLDRLETRRDAHFAGRQARDARRKALLGGFVVAQCRREPKLHAKLVPDIRTWLGTHRVKSVGKRNIEAFEGFFTDPAHESLAASSAYSEKAGRERTHRLVLLGAWVLARRADHKGLGNLVATELSQFLEQGKRVDQHKALLKDVLGT